MIAISKSSWGGNKSKYKASDCNDKTKENNKIKCTMLLIKKIE